VYSEFRCPGPRLSFSEDRELKHGLIVGGDVCPLYIALRDGEWLDDDPIRAYLMLIVSRESSRNRNLTNAAHLSGIRPSPAI
jgi:hypothetical protein